MSDVVKPEFIFTWEIENYTFGAYSYGERLDSPVFEANILDATSWFLRIYPRGSTETENGFVSCFLYRNDEKVKEICIDFKLELIDPDGKVLVSRKISSHAFKEKDNYGWFRYLEVNELECYNEGTITFQCSIIPQQTSVDTTSQCKARTKLGIDRYSFRWDVKNIDSCIWQDEKIFHCSKQMHVDVTLSAPEDSVNIKIKKVETTTNKTCFIACEICLLDENGIKHVSRQSKHLFSSNNTNEIWEFPSFLQKSKIQDKENKFLKNDTFTLMFEFAVSNDSVLRYIEDNRNSDYVVAEVEEDTVAVLQNDLRRMLTEHIGTDVSLCAENKTYKAHKSLLSIRSPVFAVMFNQDMLENQTGVVNIPDVNAEILSSFLNFVYTGTLDKLDYDSVSKLLVVADKYQVISLKNKCSSYLMKHLSILNVCDVAVIADMIGHEILRAYTIDFIAEHADAILISEDWSRCIENNIKLARDVYKKLPINSKSK